MQETTKTPEKDSLKKKSPVLLSAELSYSLTTDVLHYFGVQGVRYVAEAEAPSIFQEIKSFSEDQIDDLCDLIESKSDIPSSFYESLNLIYLLKGPKTFDHLDSEDIERNENECDGEFLCRILSKNRPLFSKLAKRVENMVQKPSTSYAVARVTKAPIKDCDFFVGKEKELEEQCVKYFKDEKWTDHCILKLVKLGKREGFQVERGSHVSHVPTLENKKRLTRHLVLRKVDTVLFDHDTCTLWVYAKGQRPQDITHYQLIAAKALTGNGLNVDNMNFNLRFVKDRNLKRNLDRKRTYAERLILKKAYFPQQADSCISSPLKATGGRRECVTEKQDFSRVVEDITSFTNVELKVVINEEKGVFDQIVIGSGRIQLGGTVSIENLFSLLEELDIIGKNYSA